MDAARRISIALRNEGKIITEYFGEQLCAAGRYSFVAGQTLFRTGPSKVGIPGAELAMQDKFCKPADRCRDSLP